jgi:ubiquinone/menaquinone biosynthesis C-methylase UbiE
MNAEHLKRCSSDDWRKHLTENLLPWVVADRHLGEHMLEVGPGPGLTTDLLRTKVARLTAVEIDPALAEPLAARLAGTNVEVVNADATDLPFPDGSFTAAASFTMLHHVPTAELQDKLLAEVARVLEPGGAFMGVDSLDSPAFQALHEDDICVPIDPLKFEERLRRAGFVDVEIQVWSIGTRFLARTKR